MNLIIKYEIKHFRSIKTRRVVVTKSIRRRIESKTITLFEFRRQNTFAFRRCEKFKRNDRKRMTNKKITKQDRNRCYRLC